jgi:hypothetical protein
VSGLWLRNDRPLSGLAFIWRLNAPILFPFVQQTLCYRPVRTVLLDKNAAMSHALVVARELMFKSTGMLGQRWSAWTMLVKDKDGKNVLMFPLSEVPEGLTRH